MRQDMLAVVEPGSCTADAKPVGTGGGQLEPAFAVSAVHHGCRVAGADRHPTRPLPDPATGGLVIDPEIVLKARRFELVISFFYSSHSDADAEYGRARLAGVGGHIVSPTSAGQDIVSLQRGDFSVLPFKLAGSSGGVTTYLNADNAGEVTTLSFDGTAFTEYFVDGMQLTYQAQVTGTDPVKHPLVRVRDAAGNAHTYVYGSGVEEGLLKTIQVPGGRKVTFLYAPGSTVSLLSAVQDWSNRRWTFQYDSQRYLTTFVTPLGCTTKYGYSLAGGPVTLVQSIEDARGYVTSYAYDSSRRVVSMAAGSAVWTWTYPALQ